MPGMKEIKARIKSVGDTKKITNAMYLIASAKLRKASEQLSHTRPFFEATKAEVKRVFRTADEADNRYFYPEDNSQILNGSYACLVITADKGLAGDYNHNVIKAAEALIKEHPDTKLFVVGECGRQYFLHHNIPIEESFEYTAQNPTLKSARQICETLLDIYDNSPVDKVFVIYTDLKNSMYEKVIQTRLLPFHRNQFFNEDEKSVEAPFEFYPSLDVVIENVAHSYMTGFIYGAMVDSFCCEQNARMMAMSSANKNAEKILDRLALEYNRIRQAAITQEITEVAAGARAQLLKRRKNAEKEETNEQRQDS